jgi:hypothetical protein
VLLDHVIHLVFPLFSIRFIAMRFLSCLVTVIFASGTVDGTSTTQFPIHFDEIDILLDQLGAVDDDFSLEFSDASSSEDSSPSSNSQSAGESPIIIDYRTIMHRSPTKRVRFDPKRNSVRTIVLEEMINNIHVTEDDIIPRVWTELSPGDWASLTEIRDLRYAIARPLVQTEAFHKTLKKFRGIRSLFNPLFMEYIRAAIGPEKNKLIDCPDFRQSISVWSEYCLAPLDMLEDLKERHPQANFDVMPCELRERVGQGVKRTAFVITKSGVIGYLRDELTKERARLSSVQISWVKE